MKRKRSRWIVPLRILYLVLTSAAVFGFMVSLPGYYAQLQASCPTLADCSFVGQVPQGALPWFQQAHISLPTYATFLTVLIVLCALVWLTVGVVIVWRLWGKPNEPLGLLTSYVLVLGGTLGQTHSSATPGDGPFWLLLQTLATIAFGLFWVAIGVLLLTFPTGRFAPRWTWLVLLLWIIQIGLNGAIPAMFGDLGDGSLMALLGAGERIVVYGGSFAVLFYRYRRYYDYAQCQQTKWLVFGFAPSYLLYIGYGALGSLPALGAPDSLYPLLDPILHTLTWLPIPLAIGIALLRYQLWNIDVIIRRTLVYGSLTVVLAALYFGLVVGAQTVLGTFTGVTGQQPLIIVASTLLIAALFTPLRRGLQAVIDRRFYRAKYDAARTLERFAATLRSEVDLADLHEHLLTVVRETMQPTSVSLWLRQTQQAGANVPRDQAPESPLGGS